MEKSPGQKLTDKNLNMKNFSAQESTVRKSTAQNLRRLLWIIALFPWFDFVIRQALPSIVSSTWDELLLLACLGLLIVYKRREPRYQYIPRSVILPFAVFVFCAAASVIINVVPLAVSIDAVRVVFQPMLFAAVTMYLMDDRDTQKVFFRLLVISTVLIAAFGIVQYILKLDLGLWKHAKDTGQFRITSIFSNPNALGSYFNMVLAFTVPTVLFGKDTRQRLLYIAASGVIFVALLLTFSRSAWIAFVAMMLYFVFVWNKKWLLAVPVVAAVTPFVMPDSVINRFSNLLDPTYYQMSSEYGRLAFWATALEKIKEAPLVGVGLGTFGDSVPLRHNIPFATWVDNHYLKIGAEIGVPGMLAFIGLLLALFLLAHKLQRQSMSGNSAASIYDASSGSDSPGLGASGNRDGAVNGVERRILTLCIAGVIITMSVQNVTASIFESLANAIYLYAFVGILFSLLYGNGFRSDEVLLEADDLLNSDALTGTDALADRDAPLGADATPDREALQGADALPNSDAFLGTDELPNDEALPNSNALPNREKKEGRAGK